MAAVVETEVVMVMVATMETLAVEMEMAAGMEAVVEMGVETGTGTVEEETMDPEEEPPMALLILHQ